MYVWYEMLCEISLLEGIATAYSTTSSMLMFSQALMMLEILHCALGLVKGGITTVFLQVCVLILECVW